MGKTALERLQDKGVKASLNYSAGARFANALSSGSLYDSDIESVVSGIEEIVSANQHPEELHRCLDDYTLLVGSAARFSDIQILELTGEVKSDTEFSILLNHRGNAHKLDIRIQTSKQVVTDYSVDGAAVGTTVQKEFFPNIRRALDRAIYRPLSEVYASSELQIISSVLQGLVRDNPFLTVMKLQPRQETGLDNNLPKSDGAELKLQGPRIKAGYLVDLPSGAVLSVGITGELYYVAGNRYGLYVSRENTIEKQPIAMFEPEVSAVVNPIYVANRPDIAVRYQRDFGSHRRANDARLRYEAGAKELLDDSSFILRWKSGVTATDSLLNAELKFVGDESADQYSQRDLFKQPSAIKYVKDRLDYINQLFAEL